MRIRSKTGHGPMVVLIHGAGVAGWMWKKQRFDGYRQCVVDLADHGCNRDMPFTSIEAEADAIADAIRQKGEKAHWVGHSLGAKIVLDILVRAPDVVQSAVVSSALLRPSLLASMMNSHLLNQMSVGMLRWPWLARLQAQQFGFADAEMEAAFMEDVAQMQAENLDRPIAAFCERLFMPPGLEALRCPVLLTVGSQELGAMRGSMDDLFARIPKAKRLTIQGATHNYPWTHAAIYNAALIDFWRA